MMAVDIDKLLELEAKATPATWRHDGKTTVYVGQYDTPYWETYKSAYSDGKYELDYCADGKLIAAMRNSIRELCLELRAAREFMPAANTAKEIVKATKFLLSSESVEKSQIKLYLKNLIEQYDEVTCDR